MVTRGKIRGNGSQLASYLLKKGDNDNVRVFQICGTNYTDDLKKSLVEMSLTSELTKSDKGLYHVQICPAYGEDKKMAETDWLRAVEILEQETGFSGQKRAIVLHEKKGKVHAHIVWERYDHAKGRMISDSHSRLAQDRARIKIEQELDHKRTPERNIHRPEMKRELTKLWQSNENASDFIRKAAEKGFVITTGTQRSFMVVNEMGRSFDLVRQLEGVRTKEVKERLCNSKLISEKVKIEQIRKKQKEYELGETQFAKIKSINNHKTQTMSWEEVEKKHIKQLKDFNDLRNKSWIDLKEKHFAIREAFGAGGQNMPDYQREIEVVEIENWKQMWDKGGVKEKDLIDAQRVERLDLRNKTQKVIKEILSRKKDNNRGLDEWER